MDNLTHTLTGLMLSRTGLGRLAPRGALIMMIGANIPDCDVVSFLWGAGSYLHHHRWFTHALLLTPVMALIPVLLVRLFSKGAFPWARAYLISFIATLSHPLLDLTNPYGIRLFLPFSADWPRLDIMGVVDIWIWAVLLLAVGAPAISRLVSSEIGAGRTGGRGWAIFALTFIVLYCGARAVLKQRAIGVQEARVYNDATPRRTTVFPDPLNPLSWRGVVETDEFFVVQQVQLWNELDPTRGEVYHKSAWSPAMENAKRTQLFEDMTGFSSALLWHASPDPEIERATRVEARDLRFGFRALAVVREGGQVERTWFEF